MKVYEPHVIQQEFHKSGARFRALIAGRRGGKSIAGTIEALWHANKNPGSIGWIVAPTYVDLVDVNIAMIMEWLPEESIKSWNKVEKRIELVNDAQIVFRSADDPTKLGRGRGLNWVWLDEASFFRHGQTAWESIYPALTDTRGKAWITTTPQGYDWVYETFYKPALEGNDDYAAWKFKTVENPHIDPEVVEKARQEMNDQMFRQEYEASFEKFTGLVYPDFTQEHVIEAKKLERDDLWFVGMDLGMTNPTVALLIAEDIDRVLYVVDEVYETGMIAKEVVDKVEMMLARHGLTKSDVQLFVADPSGASKRQDSPELSMFDQLRDEERGLPVVPGNNTLGAGIDRVTQLIKEGRIKVFRNCVNTIREFDKYSWPKTRDSMGNRDERPEKAFDHAMDALRYVVMSRPEHFERIERDVYTGSPIEAVGTIDMMAEDSYEQDIM